MRPRVLHDHACALRIRNGLNGLAFTAGEPDVVTAIVALASGRSIGSHPIEDSSQRGWRSKNLRIRSDMLMTKLDFLPTSGAVLRTWGQAGTALRAEAGDR